MPTTAIHKYATPVLKMNVPDDQYKFQPVPSPCGKYPFHLKLEEVVELANPDSFSFHMAGDTGGIRTPDFQKLVIDHMVDQFLKKEEANRPSFLFHLGDVVYNFGEMDWYERQFFKPYKDYPAPIFAIPGNHDSDVNPANPNPYSSLAPFIQVFCNKNQEIVEFSGGSSRLSLNQPHVYWVLETPLINIIGLYGNVTKFGTITEEQENWFKEQLIWANQQRPDKALMVCIHHPPYSADINHGSSLRMIHFFEKVFEETGILPDIVLSGHVHNYQHFVKKYAGQKEVPFIVAGAGGYDELHPVATLEDGRFTSEVKEFENVHLANYCDTRHGFLKVNAQKQANGVDLNIEYYTIPSEKFTEDFSPAQLTDQFSVEVR